ncbi:hypothetical protein C8R45DRAFT_923951 [Mycena sanguinolenta]|nr:hypothetical protein C8R45DRAFT_923951 [Mycena sanguinolenta]
MRRRLSSSSRWTAWTTFTKASAPDTARGKGDSRVPIEALDVIQIARELYELEMKTQESHERASQRIVDELMERHSPVDDEQRGRAECARDRQRKEGERLEALRSSMHISASPPLPSLLRLHAFGLEADLAAARRREHRTRIRGRFTVRSVDLDLVEHAVTLALVLAAPRRHSFSSAPAHPVQRHALIACHPPPPPPPRAPASPLAAALHHRPLYDAREQQHVHLPRVRIVHGVSKGKRGEGERILRRRARGGAPGVCDADIAGSRLGRTTMTGRVDMWDGVRRQTRGIWKSMWTYTYTGKAARVPRAIYSSVQ